MNQQRQLGCFDLLNGMAAAQVFMPLFPSHRISIYAKVILVLVRIILFAGCWTAIGKVEFAIGNRAFFHPDGNARLRGRAAQNLFVTFLLVRWCFWIVACRFLGLLLTEVATPS